MTKTYSNEDVQEILREATMLQKDLQISPEILTNVAMGYLCVASITKFIWHPRLVG